MKPDKEPDKPDKEPSKNSSTAPKKLDMSSSPDLSVDPAGLDVDIVGPDPELDQGNVFGPVAGQERRGLQRITIAQKRKMQDLHRIGLSEEEISGMLAIPRSTIHYHVKDIVLPSALPAGDSAGPGRVGEAPTASVTTPHSG